VREDLSLCARAKLLGDRSEIADDDDTAEQYEYSSFARARAKKHQIFFSEKKKKKNTREERIQTFFSFPRTTREDEKEEKQRDKERFSSLTERGENHSFSSSAIRVRILRAITAAASVAARVYSFVVCNRACVSRASEHVYRHHHSLYIRSFCVYYRFCCLGVKNFSLSLFLFLRNDRQTDTHTLCDHSSERDPRRERGKGVASASLLFSFFSKAMRKFCVVTLLFARKRRRRRNSD
jgi:hypothetical protein